MIPLGDLPGGSDFSIAYAVSEDGSFVVGYSSSKNPVGNTRNEAFRWTESGGIVGLGYIGGIQLSSEAYGVSADGSVVVGWSLSGDPTVKEQAFRWENDVMIPLGFLSSDNSAESYARGVSADGSVVVGYSRSEAFGNLDEAFIWTESEGMVGLGDLPGGSATSKAHDVTPDGLIVVGVSNGTSGVELFRWTSAGDMEGLGSLSGGGFLSVSADGSVIVGSSNGAFIYTDADSIRNLQEVLENDYGLDLTGWFLSQATDISDDGTAIVGFGTNPSGDLEAWRAVLLPPLRVDWNDPDGGDFSDSKNWVGGSVPNENQIAVFDTTSGLIYEVTFSDNETSYALQVGENSVAFNLAPSHTYTLNASDSLPAILIGASTANIEDSRAVFGNGTVRALGNVDIGIDGNRGKLTVPNGGILEIDKPPGLTDKILPVGVGSCGTGICGHMEIRSGGIVRSLKGSQIGVNTSSEGSVLVTGNESQWIDESICDVGVLGKGTITIEQGGSFNGETVVLGSESTQAERSITVTGVGSSFSTSANFSIGLGGIGAFNVNSGALAFSQDKTFLAVNEQAEGDVNVDGIGTEWITFDTLYIGYEGSGGLLVTNGGDVLSSNATISEKLTGIGSAQVEGEFSRWTIPGLLNMSISGGVAILRVLNGGK